MKKFQFSVLVLSILFLISCKQSTSNDSYVTQQQTDANGFSYETVENDPTGLRLYTLDNGLKVYLSQNRDEPTIQTFIPVRAGSTYDPAQSTGLAHYLEHMLFKGTSEYGTSNWEVEKGYLEQISALYEDHKKETDSVKKGILYKKIDSLSYKASEYSIANEYDKMVSSIGATSTNAGTSNEFTVYMNKIPSNELDKFLKLESDKFNQLVLRLFHTELEAVYEEFNRTQDSDDRKSNAAMMDALFPTHPYGQQTTIGKAEHLKNPSMVEINAYFNKYYVPNNMAVVLVGDLEFDKTIQLVADTFGKMEKKDLKHPELPKEEPLKGVVSKEVFGPNNENVRVAFRTAGVGTEDQKYITLIDMILANNAAGLMDLNLNQKQLVQFATSSPRFLNEYGLLQFTGVPKAGQTLDEVKGLLLEQVEKIKKGEFDDWMIQAVVNDLKLTQIRQYENSSSLASLYYTAFIQRQNWDDKLRYLDDLKKISKEDLVAFANKFFTGDYVVVYKRMGEDENVVKVENPGITPIQINRTQSEYLMNFSKQESEELQPVFVDYKKEIQVETLKNGLELSYITNQSNDLFNLNLIFDMGRDHSKKLSLAVGYMEYLGTQKYSAEDLKKEFYKLGVDYSVYTGNDRSYITISGLQENLDKGLSLLEHLFDDVVVDQEAYDLYVESILKSRENGKTRKDNILRSGLNSYAQYGENSRLRNIFTAEELKQMNPSELVEIIKDLNNFKHRIFYYGNDVTQAQSALDQFHIVEVDLKDYPVAQSFKQAETGKKVYFVDFDMVQTEMYFISKGDRFDPKKMALANVFNSYFGQGLSSIVFQEIRESKSLAYSAAAGYQSASEKNRDDLVFAYIGTQANKLPQAVDAMLELMNDMPEAEQQFKEAKKAALKQIASQRITKSSIFWNYQSLLKRGIDYDVRQDMYSDIENMTYEDMQNFFDNNVKGQNYSISIIGNKNDLDMKSLEKLGSIQEMDVDYLFNYKEVPVKQ